LEARARLLVVIAIHFLLQLAHNFSFGVDFMPFATQNNGTSLLPSEVGNDCTSSSPDESASVDAGDPSIPMPNLFKPSPRSSFKVSNVPLSKGHAMTIGPIVNLHLGSPKRGDISRRGSTAKHIGTRSSTMAVKAL
jgi:hypothetical protein